MHQQPPRPVIEIDEDLRLANTVRRAAEGELAEVRRRQEQLADLEASLLVAVHARSTQADRLLDERLQVCHSRAADPLCRPVHAADDASTRQRLREQPSCRTS